MSNQTFEVKEDEEQGVKFGQITELLLAAGYFRARIKGLSPFDKVVGGLTWCIQHCAVDVDVDLLYRENSTIGQKIGLTEKIVSVLPKMKCPHPIEPHQIQGLDFIHIFPVVQWLVKKALETRGEREASNRAYSLREFRKNHGEILENRKLTNALDDMSELNIPKRRLQPLKPHKNKEGSVLVGLTLLEFGNKVAFGGPAKEDTKTHENDTVLEEMEETKRKKKIDTKVFGNILSMTKDELNHATEEYNELRANAKKAEAEDSITGLSQAIDVLINKDKIIDRKMEEMSPQKEDTQKQIDDLQIAIFSMEEKIAANNKEMHETTKTEDVETLNKMRKLIAMNEKIKKNESDFRQTCKDKAKDLGLRNKNATEELKKLAIYDDTNSESIRQKEILSADRLKLAKRTKLVIELERRIDAVPSRGEMSQYQRRFVELYGQMDSKQNEMQNFFTMFNNLGDQRGVIEKEIKLMNSIHDGFDKTIGGNQYVKHDFITQLREILKGVRDAKKKTNEILGREETSREDARRRHQELVKDQQKYFTIVKKIQDEAQKSEAISQKLAAIKKD